MNARRTSKAGRRQSFNDGARAVVFALAVHAAGLGLLWLGSMTWQPKTPDIAPSFTLVDAAPYVEAERREQRAREQERLAEAQAEEAQRRLEQAQREEAERRQALQREREQQSAEQERQAELERQRQQQLAREREAEQARRAERQQLERERREAEQARQRELEELRRQREAAQREREEQERRLAEIAEQREREAEQRRAEAEAERLRLAREQAESQQREATLREEYISTIAELIRRNWIRPPTTRPGVRCAVRVVQIPGGEIIDSAIASPCNADEVTRRSIISAVERADELPYRGYEDVFEKEIVFTFVYDG